MRVGILWLQRYGWGASNKDSMLSVYMDFRYKDKTVMRPSYLYNGNPYTGKAVFLYRNSARVFCINPIIPVVLLMPCVPTCLDAVPTLACAMAPQCLGDRCERDCLSGLSYEDRIMPRDTNAPSDSEATLYTALISICFYPDFLFMERNSEQHPSNWTPFEYLVTNFVLKLKLGGGGGEYFSLWFKFDGNFIPQQYLSRPWYC